ncbi:MAG: hypothetical protein KF727_01295 [Microbacteriaceae bacterium]|nr:hypothetical protein [Microbacteriaceae bacterium]
MTQVTAASKTVILRRPWSAAQFVLAAVLALVSLFGIVATVAFDAIELTFSFQGAIQAFAIFPGFVLSLVVNGVLMGVRRAPEPNLLEKILLVIEFVLIAALLVFHFVADGQGVAFGLAMLVWPVAIPLAIAIAIVAIVRLARASGEI